MSVTEEQMMAAMAEQGAPPVSNEPELVGGVPAERLPEETTIADDVPRDVEEGAFVINAPAAEFMGYNDLADMLIGAMKKARELGLDKPESDDSISDEEIVNLLVSKGEVLIPPHLAKIIGYDTLNKINARGEREVSRRQEEAAQKQQAQEQPQMAPANPGDQVAQLAQQQSQPQEPPVQMMALGGEAEVEVDTRKGYMDLATSPLVNRDRIKEIQKFAEDATQEIRKAYGTKALAIDNELDSHRHLLGAALLYKEFAPNVADTMLDANEVMGMVGDYLGSSGPGAVSSEESRNMDYHNNDVARNLVSQIPMDKLSQMNDQAMKVYIRRYFDEVRDAMQDGSIEAVDPSLVPMFHPKGNELYEPLQPSVNTENVYVRGSEGNWVENPNHPDFRQKKAVGGKARMPSPQQQAYETAQYIDPSDRDIGVVSRDISSLPRMKEVPYGDKPPEQEPFDALMDAAEGREGKVDQYPEVMDAQTYFNFTQALRPQVGRDITTEEALKTLKAARDMISDREHAKYLEMLEKSKIPGDNVLGRPYAPDYDYSDKGYQYYDEEDDPRMNMPKPQVT